MASSAWLPQEVQPSTSQAPSSAPSAGVSSLGTSSTGGPSTGPPTPSDGLVMGTPTSKGASDTRSDSMQGPAQAKFVTAPGYVVSPASFSYNVPPNVNTTSGSSQQLSSSPVIKSNLPDSSPFLQASVPGLSTSSGPSFSYNVAPVGVGYHSGQQFHSSTPNVPGHSQWGKNTPSPAAFLQPPVPGQMTRPSVFVPGAAAQGMPPPLVPPPVAVPQGASSSAANFSFNRNPQQMQKDQSLKFNTADVAPANGTESSTPSVSHSASHSAHITSSSATTVSSTPNLRPAALWMPTAPFFQIPPGMSGTPVTPGPPGIASSILLPSSVTVPSASGDSSSSALLRPIMSTSPLPSNPAVQQQAYPLYPSVPPMAAPSQGLWLQPPQIGGLPRPPFIPYPASFHSPFPSQACSMPLPSVALPDSQPPGVAPVGAPGGIPTFSSASGNQLAISSGIQPELSPGIGSSKHVNDIGTKDGAVFSEQLDAWTAHRTEIGAIYYYNALTRESTYEKPAGFKGEPGNVTVQPTPVLCERLAGTDWEVITTNDGKKYYHNTKTKLTSWQIPPEVTELKKRQNDDALKEQSISASNTNLLTEKGTAPVSLSAPAVTTGGRDATALRAISVPGSSSALDLIKKKLQDSGSPATSLPVPDLTGTVTSELNGSRAIESTIKGPESENSKDKLKDANGDGILSDSSSDSEDVDCVPTKEECIIQFKEMLKERGVAPFSKWEKELPKIVFDPRFKAIPGYSDRRSLFEHYVRTRAEEERKEKRAAQKAVMEGFKQLLEEAKEDINHNTDYQTFKKKWGHDPRFEALDRKELEVLLNERILRLKRAAEEKALATRAAAVSSFKSMLRDKGDITESSRWSKVKDSLRNDPRYKSVKHGDKEVLFNEYISDLKAAEEEEKRKVKGKQEEEEKLKERERALRKRKEREEEEVERVRSKARRKEAVESYQALLVETIKDPQASWTESKSKLEKDPQGRAANPFLDQSDLEKLFREHVKILHERCAHEFRALLAEVITPEAAAQETDVKTVLTTWSAAKHLLKGDPRYTKMPKKGRESLWRRHVEDMQRRQKFALNKETEKYTEARSRSSVGSGKHLSGSRRTHERR